MGMMIRNIVDIKLENRYIKKENENNIDNDDEEEDTSDANVAVYIDAHVRATAGYPFWGVGISDKYPCSLVYYTR